MEYFVGAVLSLVTVVIYCKFFAKAGENPVYAIVPFLNFYTLCSIVGATLFFWIYLVAAICTFLALISGMIPVFAICLLVLLLVELYINIRLLLANLDEWVWVAVLIVCQVIQFFRNI